MDDTLGAKISRGNRGVWRPIKGFLDPRTELGIERLVGSMSTFGADGFADAVGPSMNQADVDPLAVGYHENHESRRLGGMLGEFRTVLE